MSGGVRHFWEKEARRRYAAFLMSTGMEPNLVILSPEVAETLGKAPVLGCTVRVSGGGRTCEFRNEAADEVPQCPVCGQFAVRGGVCMACTYKGTRG